jgi:type VI secretion system secreted protein VgrG
MKNRRLIPSVLVALAGLIPASRAGISQYSFAVLAGTTVTSIGDTVLNGNLGVYPGPTITGFGPGIVNGTSYAGGLVAEQAESDALAAYTALLGETPSQNLTGQDLGGLTLAPGVYNFTTAALLTGALTLDAQGDPNAQFVFQIASSLTTASSSSVVLEDGALVDNVSWQIGSTATLGTGTSFNGVIYADTSITMDNGASLNGNAFALTGAVSLDDNDITIVPEPNTFLSAALWAALFGAGLGLTEWWRKKRGILKDGGALVMEQPDASGRQHTF